MNVNEDNRARQLDSALNRLAKWRSVFAGWQLGTRTDSDPESQAVRDHRESTLLQRIELSAITRLLIEKGVFTLEEMQIQLLDETEAMEAMLEKRFPGFKATAAGMQMDVAKAAETMKGWRP